MQVSDKVNRNAAATYGIMCSLNIKARKHILAPLAIMKQRLYMNTIGALGEASLLSKKLRIAKMVRNIRGEVSKSSYTLPTENSQTRDAKNTEMSLHDQIDQLRITACV